jgi:hypothetical protein
MKPSDFSHTKNSRRKLKGSPSIPHDKLGRKSLAPHHRFEPPSETQHEELDKANFKVVLHGTDVQSTAGLLKSDLPRVSGPKRSQTGQSEIRQNL